jgi:hypothetical protein
MEAASWSAERWRAQGYAELLNHVRSIKTGQVNHLCADEATKQSLLDLLHAEMIELVQEEMNNMVASGEMEKCGRNPNTGAPLYRLKARN